MADSYVCSGAIMKCSMGTSQAKLTVLPSRTVFLTGQPMANISDHLSMVNLAPFGRCHSLGFPATASATAANHGSLTPMPCMHNTPFPWMGGKNDYIIKGDPALLKSSTCSCMWGGTISITDDGQTDTGSPDMSKKPYVNIGLEQLAQNYIDAMKSSGIYLHDDQSRKEKLVALLENASEHIEQQEMKAKEVLENNVKNRVKNCTKDGYYIGERENGDVKVVIDGMGNEKQLWPEPNFKVGTTKLVLLMPGTVLDRYGDDNGLFFGKKGDSFTSRCLPKDEQKYEYSDYRIEFPVFAIESEVASGGFGERGGGKQYHLFFNNSTMPFRKPKQLSKFQEKLSNRTMK